MKRFTYLSFCLLWLVPLVGLQASENFFWGDIQLDGSFCIKEDSYRVHINGMHPGREDNEMELNGILEDTRSIAAYRIRWHHAPSIHFERDMDEYDLEQNTYDPKGIFSFTGRGITLATHFLASIDLARLRVGLGAGVRCSFFSKMVGKWVNQTIPSHQQGLKNQLPGYIPAASYYFTWTPLVRCGLKLREATNYTLLLDGTWAPINYSFSEFGKSYCWVYNRSFDLGATWETHFTDYMHWSLRLGYSFCFHNEIVEAEEPSSADHLIAVGHYIGGVVAQVGIGISIPLFNKCPMDGCYTKLDHTHGGKYYKGKRAL